MVSVIMNSLNEERHFLEYAINSYLYQDYPVELILSMVEGDKNIDYVDRTFPTVKIVTMPREKHPISKGIKSPVGSYMQLNNALGHMDKLSAYFCFASSNDIAYPHKLSIEVSMLSAEKKVCYSAFNGITTLGKFIKTVSFHDYDHDKHLNRNFVSDCALMKRSLIEKYRPFREELKNYAYWDLWLRIYEGEGNVFVYNDIPTWGYRQNAEAMHTLRKKSPEQVAQDDKDREFMLSLHR